MKSNAYSSYALIHSSCISSAVAAIVALMSRIAKQTVCECIYMIYYAFGYCCNCMLVPHHFTIGLQLTRSHLIDANDEREYRWNNVARSQHINHVSINYDYYLLMVCHPTTTMTNASQHENISPCFVRYEIQLAYSIRSDNEYRVICKL